MERIPSSEIILPQIDYLGDVNQENSPVSIHLDRGVISDLFKEELGMNEEQVLKTRIVVLGKGGKDHHNLLESFRDLGSSSYGSASIFPDKQGRDRIKLNVSAALSEMKTVRKELVKYSQKFNNRKPGLSLRLSSRDFYPHNWLFSYLKKAGPDRSAKFLDYLMPYTLEGFFLRTLIHEGNHVQDLTKDRFYIPKRIGISGIVNYALVKASISLGEELRLPEAATVFLAIGAVLIGAQAFYWLDPGERDSRRLAKKLKKHKYLNAIDVKLNRPWDKI